MFSKFKEFDEKLKDEPFGNRLCFCIYTLSCLIFGFLLFKSFFDTQTFPLLEFVALSIGYLGFKMRNEKNGEVYMYSTVIASLLANLGAFV